MRVTLSVVAVAALAALAAVAIAGGAMWWDIDAARMASGIEIKIHSNGTIEDVEYHVPVATVPTAAIAKMGELYEGFDPASEEAKAEKEYEGGELFFELAWTVTWTEGEGEEQKEFQSKHEVMFTPSGEVHSKEIRVHHDSQSDQQKYPDLPQIRQGVMDKYGEDNLVLEVILDAADELVEYHVKVHTDVGTPQEKHHKLIVTKDGFLAGAYLEVVSELEVPVPPR